MDQTCQFCRTPLERGYVELQSSFFSFLAYGLSYLILTFSATETFEIDALRPAERVEGFLCPQCAAVVVTNQPWRP